tara:strand:+ start:275 stop:442 length:168 start_codon:yes stop_codon:yes gene_type:complete
VLQLAASKAADSAAFTHAGMNQKLIAAGYPVRVDCLTTVWTVLFTQPGRCHWFSL